MKIIFLDIDGVLNSAVYDRQKSPGDSNIDKTRLALVKELVDKTGAKIVFSTSWRDHWDKNPEKREETGVVLDREFSEAGLEIYDKTPKIGYLERSEEISLWLKDNPDVTHFVILDDHGYGWGDLLDNFVQTNYRIGRGLEQDHIQRAIDILNK